MARKIEMDLQINGTEKAIKDFERLDDTIDETGKSLGNLGNASVGNISGKFKNVAKGFETAAKGISGAVNIAAGSFGLLGVEGENIQKTLLKVQSALALTTGFKDMAEFVGDLAGSTELASAAQAAYTFVVGTSTGAMKALKLAIAATGIGALVVGLGLLVVNFEDVSAWVSKTIDKFEFLKSTVESVTSVLVYLGIVESEEEKKSKKRYEEQTKRYEAERKAIEDLNKEKLDNIDKEIARNESLGLSVDHLNIKRKEEEIAIQKKKLAEAEYFLEWSKNYGFFTKESEEYVNNIRKATENLEFELEIIKNKQITSNKEKNDKITSDNKSARDKENDDAIKSRQARNEQVKKEEQEDAEIRRKKQEDFVKSEEERIALELEMKNREDLAAAELKTIQDETDIKAQIDFLAIKRDIELQNTELTESERLLIIQKYQNQINDLNGDNISKITEKLGGASSVLKEIASVGAQLNTNFGDTTVGLSNIFGSLTDKIAVFADASASPLEKVQAGLSLIGDTIGNIANIMELSTNRNIANIERERDIQLSTLDDKFKKGVITESQLEQQKYNVQLKAFTAQEKIKKKAFDSNKKLQIANAVITGLQGALAAYTSAQVLPPPANFIVGGIGAAAVAALTAVQISQISKQKYQGGTAPTTPNISVPDTNVGSSSGSGSNQLPTGDASVRNSLFGVNTGAVGGASNIEGIGGGSGSSSNNGPQRVYVVESDITGVQNRVSVIQADSTIE